MVSDKNGNPTASPNGTSDKSLLINTAPEYFGGFQNTFKYKGVQLDVLLQFVRQVGANYFFGQVPGQLRVNQPVTVLDRWKAPGDAVHIQRYTTGALSAPLAASLNAAGVASDADFTDASYIRVKNVSISWQIPGAYKKRTYFQSCRIYLQGQNLLTITKYIGLDPESKNSLALPPLRVLTMGLQLTL
jgi:hypothetical protein